MEWRDGRGAVEHLRRDDDHEWTNPYYHINNALWVADRVVSSSQDCTYLGLGLGTAWVEVGYQAEGGSQWPQFFYWVDCRINSEYYEEAIAVANPIDRNQYNQFRIIRNAYQSSYWDVTIDSVNGTDYRRVTAYNPMTADSIEIGGEASGKHGAYAANAYFQTNQYIWITSSGSWNYYDQTAHVNDGTEGVGVDYHQYGRWQSAWSVLPGASGAIGGRWRTNFPL